MWRLITDQKPSNIKDCDELLTEITHYPVKVGCPFRSSEYSHTSKLNLQTNNETLKEGSI